MTTSDTSAYGVFPSFNNKTPKEGPRYIPMSFDFSTVDTWDVDMMQLQQAGKISTLQAFYVDNSLNTVELTITLGLGGQVIKVQPGYQGYMTALVNNVPKFSVSSPGGVSAIVFALNFPVVNDLWPASPNASASETVTVSNFPDPQNANITEVGGTALALGSAASSASVPVVVASDQAALPTNLLEVGGTALSLGTKAAASSLPCVFASNQPAAFQFPSLPSSNIAVTTASQNVALMAGSLQFNIRVTNASPTANIYFRMGTTPQTAVVGDTIVTPGRSICLYINNATNLGIIGDAAAIVNITYLSGLPS